MASTTKPRRAPEYRERNTHRLPSPEPLRRAMLWVFRAQRLQILRALGVEPAKGWKHPRTKAFGEWNPEGVEFPEFELGALAISERMTPIIAAIWDRAGQRFNSRIGLDPDAWDVVNPHTRRMIEDASLAFCESTNATTSLDLDQALRRTRAELAEGIVDRGETLNQLTKRVQRVFDRAEKWRARSIAASETSRAVHAAQEQAAKESGVVAGFEWLLSEDACPLCQTVARRAKAVRLGQAFAINGDHPVYAEVRFPPLHPSCQCTVVEVLKPEYGGPDNPQWSPTLQQPEPTEEDGAPPKPRGESIDVPVPEPQLPVYGPSRATVERDLRTSESTLRDGIDSVLGPEFTREDLASLVGALDDAKVTVSFDWEDGLRVVTTHPEYSNERYFRRTESGETYCANEVFKANKTGSGIGREVFARQVENCARMGLAYIKTHAVRGPGYNGYYTWPRFGYDGPIPKKVQGNLPDDLKHATRLRELMASEAGRAWWKEHGVNVHLKFNLRENSYSRETLSRYQLEKERDRLQTLAGKAMRQPLYKRDLRAEEPPQLDSRDEAILDRVNDSMRDWPRDES